MPIMFPTPSLKAHDLSTHRLSEFSQINDNAEQAEAVPCRGCVARIRQVAGGLFKKAVPHFGFLRPATSHAQAQEVAASPHSPSSPIQSQRPHAALIHLFDTVGLQSAIDAKSIQSSIALARRQLATARLSPETARTLNDLELQLIHSSKEIYTEAALLRAVKSAARGALNTA
ncbi:MAG: hypothetical protein R3194_11620, partial [Limnobacter sp.]|nr:hypothetical protein [Limnobacter sp.]